MVVVHKINNLNEIDILTKSAAPSNFSREAPQSHVDGSRIQFVPKLTAAVMKLACEAIWLRLLPHCGRAATRQARSPSSDGCFSCSQYVKVAITSSIFVMEILGQNHAFYSNWHLASVASHVIIIRSIIIMLRLLPTLDHDFLGQIAQSSISLVGHSSLVHNRFSLGKQTSEK